MKNPSNKGIIYCRVSSHDQVQGTSLENQKKACLEYAQNKGIENVKIFIEKGESATAINRTEFLRALEYCRKSKRINAFIVWKVDRFARNTTDHFSVRAKLLQYGTILHSVTEPISQDPQGKLMETLLAGFAEFENEVRKQRCTAGMQARLRDGIWPWHPPMGYIHSKKREGRRKLKPDEPDSERFYLIQKGLKAYATGKYSIIQLTDLLNKWGLRTRTDKPMFKQATERLLTEKFYAGILVDPWTEEEYPGQHQPMITHEEYRVIQYIKLGRSNHADRPRIHFHPDFPLRSFVSCSCGQKYTAGWRQGRSKKYPYYHCNNKACKHYTYTIPKATMEKTFVALLERITPQQRCREIFKAALLDKWNSDRQAFTQAKEYYEKQIVQLKERKEQLLRMRLNSEISQEEFSDWRDKLENQITGMEISKNEANIEELDLEMGISYVERFIEQPARLWMDMKFIDQQVRFQWMVFPKGLKYDKLSETYCTAQMSCIFTLLEQFKDGDSQDVAAVGQLFHRIVKEIKEIISFFKELEEDQTAKAA